MDTTWEFTVTGLARKAAEAAIADASAIVRDVEAHDSIFDPRSDLSRFNAAGPRGLDAPSTGFLEVLRVAREAAEEERQMPEPPEMVEPEEYMEGAEAEELEQAIQMEMEGREQME